MISVTRKIRRDIFACIPVLALLMGGHGAIAQPASGSPPRGPGIVVPERLLTGVIRSDAPIDVRFVTAPDAAVDLASLRVWVRQFNGWLDVTDMLLRTPGAQVGGWGIHLDGGLLPAGEHEVRVSFRDMKGRAVEETKTIRIAMAGISF